MKMKAEKPASLKVNYQKHGILKKSINYKTNKECWVFEGPETVDHFEEFNIVDILNELSIDGFELVTCYDGNFILRTKKDINEVQEFYSNADEYIIERSR